MPARPTKSPSTRSHEDGSSADLPPAKRRRKGHSMEALLAREVGLMRAGSEATNASFVGSASGIHFIRSVYGALGSSAADITSPETNMVPGEDDRLEHPAPTGASRRIWSEQEVNNDSASSSHAQPSFDQLMTWTESFFDNWHPPFPVLHAPTVLECLEKVSHEGISTLPPWNAVIIKAIISISLADRRQSSTLTTIPIPGELVFNNFDDAHEAVLPALTRPATTNGLQAVVCVQIFLVSMLRLNTASRLGGLIVQMAFQLGLHRCPMRFQAFTSFDCQLRKRIFWSIYCIERYICQAMGLPLTIRDEDVDVCPLDREIHDPKLQQNPPSSREGTSIRIDSSLVPDERLQLLNFLVEHAQLRGSIIELRNKRVEERDKNPDVAVFINAKLTRWWNEIQDFFEQHEESCPISTLHKSVLETLKHESIIMLHRPMLASRKDTASYAGAVHACIGAAKSIISVLHALRTTPLVNDLGSRPPMMWPSFTWAVWMSAFVLLYATAEGIINGIVAGRSVEKSLQILRDLATRGSVWPNASAVAIDDLRSILTQRHDIPTTPLDASAGNNTSSSRPSQSQQISPLDQRDVQQRQSNTTTDTSTFTQQSDIQSQTFITAQMSLDPLAQHETQQGTDTSHRDIWVPHSPSFARPSNIYSDRTSHVASGQEEFTDSSMPDLPWPDSSFLPRDVPPAPFGGIDPFQGFDIPFWFGQDNYVAWMGNEN